MYTLQFTFRDREISAKMEIDDMGKFTFEYRIFSKDGGKQFVFQKSGLSNWCHVSGDLIPELKEAILDALILRFGEHVVKVFWYKGERQIVEVSFPSGGGSWNVNINQYFIGTIKYNPGTKEFSWNIRNESWLLDRHMEYFVELIKKGDIKSPDQFLPY